MSTLVTQTCSTDLDRLGDEIAELSAHLEAATAHLLDLIREFDARGGWGQGFRSCAAWLTWRVGLAPGAAREHVRVARALGTLPRLRQALVRGELSYSKVRELTRVATQETEERLLAVARAGTAEHVERIVRAWRRVDRIAEVREAQRRWRRPGKRFTSARATRRRMPSLPGAAGRDGPAPRPRSRRPGGALPGRGPRRMPKSWRIRMPLVSVSSRTAYAFQLERLNDWRATPAAW
jgi:hypothetical protein